MSDPLRCRILLLLEDQELTVTELCSVLQLPQSTVSRHLKTLLDGAWLTARREGTSRRYSVRPEGVDPSAQRLWQFLRDEVVTGPTFAQDRSRLAALQAQRRSRSQEFFSASAARWSEVRRELFGRRFELEGLLGLLDGEWVVGDLGCGVGQTAALLAPLVRRVIAVDESEAMLAAARLRLGEGPTVELRQGRLESLPIPTGSLDAAVIMLVLHHVTDPEKVLGEAARTLKPGGRLLLVDMMPHEREQYRQDMGHVWLGFEERQVAGWLGDRGFDHVRFRPLPADPDAQGPTLFAISARRIRSTREDGSETTSKPGRAHHRAARLERRDS